MAAEAPMPAHHDAVPFWEERRSDLLSRFETTAEYGLPESVANRRLVRYGPNVLKAPPRFRVLRAFASRFRNPLTAILLGAAAISAVTGDGVSAAIIAGVVAIGTLLETVQEARAHGAVERLKQRIELQEKVIRGGRAMVVPASGIVPGDVVLLAPGDRVPADGLIVEAHGLFVNEALLTGEPFPVEKAPRGEIGAGSRENALFMGTNIVAGEARMVALATGPASKLGEIATSLEKPAAPSALESGTYHFGLMIVRITGFLLLLVLLAHAAMHRSLMQSFMFALALAVGLTPELLPMVVSVTLARGAVRMASRRVIVKRLAAIHDLGSIDILCTDKTGTLTESKISVERSVDALGHETDMPLRDAWLNSSFARGIRTPLDDAILAHAQGAQEGWSRLDEEPFNFEKRRVSVLLSGSESNVLVVKGAPEDILKLCDCYQAAANVASPLGPQARAAAQEICAQFSRDGFRLLAVARKVCGRGVRTIEAAGEGQLMLAGFIAFLDPPKPSAAAALEALRRNNVAVKVVTGDNELVTQHVCRALGIKLEAILMGSEVAEMSDEALSHRAERTNLFCRITPVQKNRIILALRRRGHVVGYMGDGINDAPSLHTANVGISVDTAVDVAKEAADMVLLDRDLGVLNQGVTEGRRTFSNIMKYVMMATSSNFGNMFSMAGASLWLPFLPMLPIQILLNNLLYDLSETAIPFDRVDPGDLTNPRHWDVRFVRSFMFVMGPLSSVFDVLTFVVMMQVFHATIPLFQTGWFVESLATQVLVIFLIRTRGNPLKSRPHPLLAVTSLAVLALAAILPYTAPGRWFEFQPLPAKMVAAIGAVTLAYLACAQAVKSQFYRVLRSKSATPRQVS